MTTLVHIRNKNVQPLSDIISGLLGRNHVPDEAEAPLINLLEELTRGKEDHLYKKWLEERADETMVDGLNIEWRAYKGIDAHVARVKHGNTVWTLQVSKTGYLVIGDDVYKTEETSSLGDAQRRATKTLLELIRQTETSY